MVLCIAHKDGERIFLDKLDEVRAPFDPADVVAQFSKVLIAYRIRSVGGDNYSAEWVRSAFRQHGISYVSSEYNRSELYLEALPMFSGCTAVLLDNNRLVSQLADLERSAGRSSRDAINHPRGRMDDCANACCGALVHAAAQRISRPRQPIEHIGMSSYSPLRKSRNIHAVR
jgi:hypothetical protein